MFSIGPDAVPRRRRQAASDAPSVVLSVSWTGILSLDPALSENERVEVIERPSDWGLSGPRKRLHHIVNGLRILWQARHADAVVVCNAAIEMLVMGALGRFIAPRTKLVAVDFLTPEPRRGMRRMMKALGRFDRVLCIRSGDIPSLNELCGVSFERLGFIAFPADRALLDRPTADDGFVYSGGAAHRDWSTLVAALDYDGDRPPHVRISTSAAIELPAGLERAVQILGPLPPEEARAEVARAGVVVIANKPTFLPHGPLVLLDAMALGKPVVATATSGSIDYIEDGVSGFLVAPQDPAGLAMALGILVAEPALRLEMGRAARNACRERFTAATFAEALLGHLAELGIRP